MTDSTYRNYDAERDHTPFVRAMSLAFGGSTQDATRWIASVADDMMRVLERDGTLLGGLSLYPFGHWFGGRSVPARGVAGVGITPEARGRGVGTELMCSAVREMHDAGVAVSTLYPAVKAVYRRAGYEMAGVKCVVDTRLERIRVRDRSAALRPATEADHGAIEQLESRRARLHDGNVDRSAHMWRRLRTSPKYDTHTQLVEEDGRLTGYVQYRMVPGKESLIPCQDMVATTPGAARRLLTFLADQGMQFPEARWLGHPGDDLVTATEGFPCSVRIADTWMARIVHVENAIAARGYAEAVRGEVHLDVADDVCPANAGRWVVRVEGGQGEAVRGGNGNVRLDVRALAPLYTGFTTPRALRTQGRIDGDERLLATLGAIFAGPLPWMQDEF